MIPYGRKTLHLFCHNKPPFEGSVIPYGRKTDGKDIKTNYKFEGSVIPYGRKTETTLREFYDRFEGSVIPYGERNWWISWEIALKGLFQTVDKARPRDLGSGFFYVIKHMKYQQFVV